MQWLTGGLDLFHFAGTSSSRSPGRQCHHLCPPPSDQGTVPAPLRYSAEWCLCCGLLCFCLLEMWDSVGRLNWMLPVPWPLCCVFVSWRCGHCGKVDSPSNQGRVLWKGKALVALGRSTCSWKWNMVERGYLMERWLLRARLCAHPEISLASNSVQTLQKAFGWDCKPKSAVCIDQKNHIQALHFL